MQEEKNKKGTSSEESTPIPLDQAFSLEKTLKASANFSEIINKNFGPGLLSDAVGVFEQLETVVTSIAHKFAGNRDLVNEIKGNISQATTSVELLGGTMADVVNIQMGVIKGLQTQVIVDKDAYQDLFAIGNLVNDGTKNTAESTAKLVKEFADAGVGLYQVSKEMGGLLTTARQMGVSTAAVYSQLSANMSKLNLYNFDNGVQGMAKMAAQAAGLRINMGDTLKLADKLFDPEEAIKMSASFQALGVNVTNLLDPYKLMDMARNDPAELQKSLLEATKQLTYFDEKNQKMSILPGAQGQLRELAKTLGMSSEELAKMAISSGDLDRKMSEIKFSPEFTNDDDRLMIAHMAQLGQQGTKFEGKYVVSLGEDKAGNPIMKAVDELDKNDKERINKMSEEAKKSPAELQLEGNHILTNIANNTTALSGISARALGSSSKLGNMVQEVGKKAQPYQQATAEYMGVKYKGANADVTGINEKVQGYLTNLGSSFSDIVSGTKEVTTVLAEMQTSITDTLKDMMKNGVSEIKKRAEIIATNNSTNNTNGYSYTPINNTNPMSVQNNSVVANPSVINPLITNVFSPNMPAPQNNNIQNTNEPNNGNLTVNGIIEHKFPDNLQNIWNMALNDPNWMSTLQKKLAEINSNNNALMGAGR